MKASDNWYEEEYVDVSGSFFEIETVLKSYLVFL